MIVEKVTFEEGDLLVAEVQPSEFPPVRYRGRLVHFRWKEIIRIMNTQKAVFL
jgi:hypothetical protein